MAQIPTIGRTLLVVMKDGTDRPLIVTAIFPQEDPTAPLLNGHVLLDGQNDRDNNPFETPEGDDAPLVVWATSLKRDDNKQVGTWHWPERV